MYIPTHLSFISLLFLSSILFSGFWHPPTVNKVLIHYTPFITFVRTGPNRAFQNCKPMLVDWFSLTNNTIHTPWGCSHKASLCFIKSICSKNPETGICSCTADLMFINLYNSSYFYFISEAKQKKNTRQGIFIYFLIKLLKTIQPVFHIKAGLWYDLTERKLGIIIQQQWKIL